MIREELDEELSRAGMENNAARKPERRAMAILKSALAKQWETAGLRRQHKSTYWGHLNNIVFNIEILLEILRIQIILCTISF